MNHEQNVGVREARLGLALLICVLLAVGYLILHYLAGTAAMAPVETRPGTAPPPFSVRREDPSADFDQPRVLTIESSDSAGASMHTSQRPERFSPAPAEASGEALVPQPESSFELY